MVRRLFAAVLLAGCAHSMALHLDASGQLVGDYAPQIHSDAEWRALAAAPTREAMAHTDEIKVIIDLENDKALYLLNSQRWEIHYYFIREFLPGAYGPGSEERFADREYRSPARRFILGSVIHYKDPDLWTFELDFPDLLDLPRTIDAYRQVKAALWVGDKLKYHPVPAAHVAATEELRKSVDIATTDEIFGTTRYQAINPGVAYGKLRIFDKAFAPSEIGPHDIPVLAELPLDLPVCAGVISGMLQAPLSHIAILSVNRGTPNMSLRDATRDARLRALEGKVVRLHVSPQEWSIETAALEEAERAWSLDEPRVAELKRDDRDTGLPALTTLYTKDGVTVGAKAAQLGELAHLVPASVPRAFAVPFHGYVNHLAKNGIDKEIHKLLGDKTFLADARTRERALEELKKKIIAAPVDAELVAAIRARIVKDFPGVRVRFRSSTNAEDLPGFNGAGLYTSTVTPLDPDEQQIAAALVEVWASVWNFQGFEERTHFGLDHERVAMGVLVQESIDHPAAIGVAITANPYSQGLPGRFINVQTGEGSVTSPGPGEIPEQILIHVYPGRSVERLSGSSLVKGQILSDDEAMTLGGLLDKVHEHFVGDAPWQTSMAMDVEFLVAKDTRRIVLLQARPYRLSWTEGRGYTQMK